MNEIYTLEREQWVPRPIEEVFDFFSDARNLEAITPPWLRFQVLTSDPISMHCGAIVDYRLRWHGLPLRWKTEIACWDPPHRFEDLQLRGPYRLWHHTHCFSARNGGTTVADCVRYRLPFGPLAGLIHALTIRRNVERIFDYRDAKIREHFGAETAPSGEVR